MSPCRIAQHPAQYIYVTTQNEQPITCCIHSATTAVCCLQACTLYHQAGVNGLNLPVEQRGCTWGRNKHCAHHHPSTSPRISPRAQPPQLTRLCRLQLHSRRSYSLSGDVGRGGGTIQPRPVSTCIAPFSCRRHILDLGREARIRLRYPPRTDSKPPGRQRTLLLPDGYRQRRPAPVLLPPGRRRRPPDL